MRLWRFLFAMLWLLSATPAVNSDTARAPADNSFFPVAVWYGGGKARAPMMERLDAGSAERWGKDLDAIKTAGFNTVKTWVDWATAESKQGEFSFTNLDLLLHLAQERELRVIVQVYLDSAPEWIGVRYPDARFVDRSGTLIDSQSAPGYCIDHGGVRREMERFLERLSQEANRSPSLYGWDVWSEPHIINWADFPYLKDPEFCFCRYTQERFREWLKDKYGTIAALNAAWYRNFESWDQVSPPRFPTILSYSDYLDWRAFLDDKLAGDLKTRVDAIRQADSVHPIASHAAVPGLFTSPTDGYGNPDDWKMSATADFFGTSIYPEHSQSTRPWPYPMLAAGLDFTRSAGHSYGKGFWIGELQAGQGVTGMRIAQPVTPHDEEFWMWQVVAHGARSLAIYAWYPMSSGFESNGYGLIHLDGSLTDRAEAAGRVARIVAEHGAELLRAKPAPARVAILYNRLSYMVGGSQPSLSKLGNAERDSLLGAYKVFFEQQIPVDFVDAEDIVNHRLSQYRLLFLPYPVMLAKNVAEGVTLFVRDGGMAVAEARLAWNDERGFASAVIPGFGLEHVFGAREKSIQPAERPALLTEASSDLPGLPPHFPVNGEAFAESLEPLPGSSVLARFSDGETAMVMNLFGQGRAVLVGSFLGLSYEREHETSTKRLLLCLAQAAGVTPDVEVSGPGTQEIEVRQLLAENLHIVFVFNHSKEPASLTLSLRPSWVPRQARDLRDGRPVPFESRQQKTFFQKSLAAGEIWVFGLTGESP